LTLLRNSTGRILRRMAGQETYTWADLLHLVR
jgi:hypothetical protein